MNHRDERTLDPALRPLTRSEIEDRIGELIAAVAAATAPPDSAAADGPRWIRAADLIERVRPFIVLN